MRPTTAPRLVLATLILAAPLCLSAVAQTPPPAPAEPRPTLRAVLLDGVTVFTPSEIRRWLDLEEGAALPRAADDLADALERRYHREGYAKAVVEATFDEPAGRLRLSVDEGRIDAVEFEGLEGKWLAELQGNFDVRPGDVFNSRVVARALNRLLEPTRGAIVERGYDLVDRSGRRVLVIGLDRREIIGGPAFGPGQREDWYSPVDGFSPAVGFDLTLFDTLFGGSSLNQTYVRAYLSYKFARESAGFSVGFERPVVGSWDGPRLYVGAEAHEMTATDDAWRLSTLEQSVVALTFANTFRDYHDRRGYQIHAAYRANPAQEIVGVWRDDDHEARGNTTEYSFFRDDQPFRPNQPAASGKLRAILLGYTLDTRGLEQESLDRTYERHMFTSLFGTTGRRTPGVRLEWISELAPEGLGGDFDFTRHILNARAYAQRGSHGFRFRALMGASSGVLPPQRQFALGGIGSVHGYGFKEAAGEGMFLFNAEYRLGSRMPGGVRLVGFFDAGRVWSPVGGSRPSTSSDLEPTDGRDGWLKGIGGGFEVGEFRVEFGWRLDEIPKSFQMLVRFGPSF